MKHYSFAGFLSAPLSVGRPIEARNMIFPLKNDRDYATEASFAASNVPIYTLPSVHFHFLAKLMNFIDANILGLDFIFIRLSSPSTIPIPNRMLEPDVFCMIDIETEANYARESGYNVLSISDRFHMKHLEDGGDNSFQLNLWHEKDCSAAFDLLKEFLQHHKIRGL